MSLVWSQVDVISFVVIGSGELVASFKVKRLAVESYGLSDFELGGCEEIFSVGLAGLVQSKAFW